MEDIHVRKCNYLILEQQIHVLAQTVIHVKYSVPNIVEPIYRETFFASLCS